MIRFYAPELPDSPILPEGESHHCVKVLRHQPGDLLEIVDGRGGLYSCRLLEAHAKRAMVEVIERTELPRTWPCNFSLAVAPTKHLDRIEWLIEKLVELGLDRFTPVLCDRSERRELKTERLVKTAVSAMKQSLKAQMPVIDDLTPLRTYLRECQATRRFICYCDENTPRQVMVQACLPMADTAIVIGPEGDFSPAEVELALSCGFVPVTLGDSRLRTESAALFAISSLHTLSQLP